ncbi:MAG: 1-(5-phosphoribosyl)-5-[(5-phosphoribosylamino)methylideneamino]imidazole-4-carboxamide isomerase [Thermodesulfobacteriota bacterium]|nr:MAG: 1-(5-phosphoribosyl)-5-[(5-phosphoribosylamino)methylideneamino]imidazole-4-carboxamide isomerase [Candidatus Dadabacteria bacterium]|tara:strand:+ start:49043 stop:49777 length:735 start_codon:yes stop_codon:yes gene_type:complete
MMILIPAIDIKDKKCVRLYKGDYSKQTVYSDNPIDVSKKWISEGARLIHLVDLDGALEGSTKNFEIIKEIVQTNNCEFQVGGGIRSIQTIEKYLSIGVKRVILGTAVFTDETFLEKACKLFGDKIAVGLDIKDGKIAIRGWNTKIDISMESVLSNFNRIGVSMIILTSVDRDGTLEGFNEILIKDYLKFSKIPIIISGGIRDSEDLKKIKDINASTIFGVILGKSLYEKTLNLSESVKVYQDVS